MGNWTRIAAIAFASGICSSCAIQQSTPSPAVKRVSLSALTPSEKMRLLTVPTGDLTCKSRGLGSLKSIKCTDIPIIVLTDAAARGGCIVIVPYHNLVIYTKKDETEVTWNLIGADIFTFDTLGVELPTVPTGYTSPGASSSGRSYSWIIARNAPVAGGVQHIVHVKGLRGECEQGDPTMTNDPSDPPPGP